MSEANGREQTEEARGAVGAENHRAATPVQIHRFRRKYRSMAAAMRAMMPSVAG